MIFPFRRIWANLVFFSSLLVVLIVGAFFFIVVDLDNHSLSRLKEETSTHLAGELRRSWEDKAVDTTELLSRLCAPHLYRLEAAEMADIASLAGEGEGVLYVYIHDGEGRFIVDTTLGANMVGEMPGKPFARRATASDTVVVQEGMDFLEVSSPVYFGIERVGTVRVGFSLKNIAASTSASTGLFESRLDLSMERIIDRTVALGVASLVLTVVAGAFFAHRLSLPLRELSQGTGRIAGGDLSFRAPIRSRDEVGELALSFNRMTEDLRQATVSRDYVDNIIKNMMSSLVTTTPEGTISAVNQATLDLLGYREEVLIGQHLNTIFHEEGFPESERIFQKLRRAAVRQMEARLRAAGGERIPVLLSGSVIRDRGGEEQGIVCVFLDVTRQKDAENAIRGYVEQLEHSNHLMKLFTDILSHDLLNPANIITHMASHLLHVGDSGHGEELTMILRNGEKLTQLIRDASSYARVEKAGVMERSEIDLFALLASLVERLRPQFDQRGMRVIIEPGAKAVVFANGMIEDVFVNLLTNTLKYAPRGSEVRISISEAGRDRVVTVTDEGDGVPDEHKESIFERFTRMEKKGVLGAGLGLAIAKRLTELHGGRIWVEDAPTKGSVFSVSLPGSGGAEGDRGA